MTRRHLIPALVLALAADAACADSRIDGEALLLVRAGEVAAIAWGERASSSVSVGSVDGAVVRGGVTISAVTGDLTSVADGSGVTDSIAVGTIASSALQSADLVVSSGDVTSVTSGTGLTGRVRIGNVAGVAGGAVSREVHVGDVVNVSTRGGAGGRAGQVLIGNVGRR